jgi:hypothetical protein
LKTSLNKFRPHRPRIKQSALKIKTFRWAFPVLGFTAAQPITLYAVDPAHDERARRMTSSAYGAGLNSGGKAGIAKTKKPHVNCNLGFGLL